ncbi:MAG: hypothetical protein AB1489_08035 [Acidobacteriota bacterium]
MKCPDFNTLINYANSRLEIGNSDELAKHIDSGCLACHEKLDWYQRVKRVSEYGALTAPPEELVQTAYRIFPAEQPPTASKGLWEQLIAVLCFDSFQQLQPVGTRTTTTQTRQLLFRAGHYDIDVMLETTSKQTISLRGQIIANTPAQYTENYNIELKGVEKVSHFTTASNDIGEFHFPQVELARYEMRIASERLEILIGTIDCNWQHD